MRTRLLISRPGTPRGPGAGSFVSYCETTPQHTIVECTFIRRSAAARMSPPVLSK
jgi:hypothetical protein